MSVKLIEQKLTLPLDEASHLTTNDLLKLLPPNLSPVRARNSTWLLLLLVFNFNERRVVFVGLEKELTETDGWVNEGIEDDVSEQMDEGRGMRMAEKDAMNEGDVSESESSDEVLED